MLPVQHAGAAPAWPIRVVFANLAKNAFRPLAIDDVPFLFPNREADRIFSHGAPIVLEWPDPSGTCKIQFFAGQARWGDQVTSVDFTCAATAPEPVLNSLVLVAGGLPERFRNPVFDCLASYPCTGHCTAIKAGKWAGLGASYSFYATENKWYGSIGVSWSGPGPAMKK
jgi:hypothetical protein